VYIHLQYCISVWGLASQNAIIPLERKHKKIVIITKMSYRQHSLLLFAKLKLLKLKDIYKLEIAKHVHSVINYPDQLDSKTNIIKDFTQI